VILLFVSCTRNYGTLSKRVQGCNCLHKRMTPNTEARDSIILKLATLTFEPWRCVRMLVLFENFRESCRKEGPALNSWVDLQFGFPDSVRLSPTEAPSAQRVHMRLYSKSSPATRHGSAWGERSYSSYSFTTSALDGGEWSASRPGRALAPGKGPPVPIGQEAGFAPEPVWTQILKKNSFASAGDQTSIIRSSSQQPDTILTEIPRLLKRRNCSEILSGRTVGFPEKYDFHELKYCQRKV
jgi:hypothetical protein